MPHHQIREQLYKVFEDLKLWGASGMDLVEQAARLHHRAVAIHPFVNGNARWSRLLTNAWLTLHGHPMIRWPENLIGNVSPIRDEYIQALRQADTGEIDPFIDLHHRYPDRP